MAAIAMTLLSASAESTLNALSLFARDDLPQRECLKKSPR